MGICAGKTANDMGASDREALNAFMAKQNQSFTNAEVLSKYEVDFSKPLGEGMAGIVWKAHVKATGELCALKQMMKDKMEEGDLELIQNEINLLRTLKHPHLLKYIDDVEGPDNIFIITELLKGGELFDSIVEHEHYTEYDAREVMRTLIEAIQYMHSQGVVHLDLKAENLMLSDPKPGPKEKREQDLTAIKLIDFGLSCRVNDEYGGVTLGAGTPSYMSPEYLVVNPVYGKPADCWAMGVLAFTLLAGQMPFAGDDDDELQSAILAVEYEYEPEDWEDVSTEARDFIDKCLVKDPRKRMNVNQMMKHPWMKKGKVKDHDHGGKDLTHAQMEIRLNMSKVRWKKAMHNVMFITSGKLKENKHYISASEVVMHKAIAVEEDKPKPKMKKTKTMKRTHTQRKKVAMQIDDVK